MEPQKFCVYNRTRESFLSLGVAVADTTLEKLKTLIEQLAVTADTGLWMTPYRGVPVVRGLSPIDLVYLDEDYQILQLVESYPTAHIEPLTTPASSVLALPAHTITSSQSQRGDSLVICVPEEMESRLAQLANPAQPPPPPPPAPEIRKPASRSEGPRLSISRSSISRDHTRQLQIAIQKLDQKDQEEREEEKKQTWLQRLMRWLSSDSRRAYRHAVHGLVAYYWTGGAPQAYHIGDISESGIFLLTEERWFPGTMILMTLQMTDTQGENAGNAIAVQTRVVRWDKNGVGLAFVPSRATSAQGDDSFSDNGASKKTIERFVKKIMRD
jgi:uncharacterized protein